MLLTRKSLIFIILKSTKYLRFCNIYLFFDRNGQIYFIYVRSLMFLFEINRNRSKIFHPHEILVPAHSSCEIMKWQFDCFHIVQTKIAPAYYSIPPTLDLYVCEVSMRVVRTQSTTDYRKVILRYLPQVLQTQSTNVYGRILPTQWSRLRLTYIRKSEH